MSKFVALAVASTLLTGCLVSRADLAASDDRYCASIGAPKDSPNYTDCRLRLEQMRLQAATANRSVSCMSYGGITTCN